VCVCACSRAHAHMCANYLLCFQNCEVTKIEHQEKQFMLFQKKKNKPIEKTQQHQRLFTILGV
jgi:hypothetical protein